MKVVATTTMLTDLARQIGGDKVEVSGLMKAGVDPHLYQAGAGDVDAMNKADIVVYNGVHLEGKMGAIFDNLHAQKKPTIRVSDGIPSETLLDFEEDGEKRKIPTSGFRKELESRRERSSKGFSEKDPKNKSYYEDHLNAYLAELDNLDKYIRKEVESVPKDSRILVTAHDAFAYFARDYGFEVKGIQGISTASEAGTSDISTLAAFIAEHKIKAVFVESSVPIKPSSLSRLLSKHGASMFPSAANCTPTLLAASPQRGHLYRHVRAQYKDNHGSAPLSILNFRRMDRGSPRSVRFHFMKYLLEVSSWNTLSNWKTSPLPMTASPSYGIWI